MSSVAIKISSELATMTKAAAQAADRSMTGQIEHWAKLGRAAESRLSTPAAIALKQSGGNVEGIEDEATRRTVLEALAAFADLPRAAIREKLNLAGRVLFEPDPENPGGIIRISPDGTRTRGVMQGRTFVPNAGH